MRTDSDSTQHHPRKLTRQQRALFCAVGIVPVTVAGIALIRCGCVTSAWILEIVVAGSYLLWITKREN